MADPIITVADAKAFLRVDFDDEDDLINSLILTASETALSLADGLAEDDAIPESVRTAALLHVARLYDGRHDDSPPAAASSLASRFRDWSV